MDSATWTQVQSHQKQAQFTDIQGAICLLRLWALKGIFFHYFFFPTNVWGNFMGPCVQLPTQKKTRRYKYLWTKCLTFWCPLPGSSGCAVAPTIAGRPQCQKWKTQRSRGEGRFRAWAGCPAAASPRSAYLHGGTSKMFFFFTPCTQNTDVQSS